MNYDEIIEVAEAFQILASAAGYASGEFTNLFKCFNDRTFGILINKKIEKLMATEIYFPILPYGYISGIPPPRRKENTSLRTLENTKQT